MRNLLRPSHLAACGAAFAVTLNITANQVSVASRPALGANDLVNWNNLGPDGTPLGTPFSATSHYGDGLTVSGSTGPNGFERADQGGSIIANFAPGAPLLWTGFSQDPQTMTIQFASPVFGAGTQIAPDALGDFIATLSSFDSLGNLLRTDTFNGTSTQAGDDSAIYLGVLSDTENVAKIQFTVQPKDPIVGSFAINQLDLKRSFVPDSGSLTLLFGLSVIGMSWARFRRS